eukprot:TRINITY_DN1259_c1_g1_i4.p1 TRINITY_DN1259_c1_g1~~TRINITY_DN1259_c1_g1_i4.p1  ORF type:complete len:295 (+),score=35.08 TRINITY_DN1259_c1_g1_i4:113-886(+)
MTVFGGRHLAFFLLILSIAVATDQWVVDLLNKAEIILPSGIDFSSLEPFIDSKITDPSQLQDPNVINSIVAALLDEFSPIRVKLPTADAFPLLENLVEEEIDGIDSSVSAKGVELTAGACGANTLKLWAEANASKRWFLFRAKGNIKAWICFKVSFTNRIINFQVISQDANLKGTNLVGKLVDLFLNEDKWMRKLVEDAKKEFSQLDEGVEEQLIQDIGKRVSSNYKKVVDEFVDRLFFSTVEVFTDADYIEFKLSL